MPEFRRVSDIGECRRLWEQFSRDSRFFNTWEYRACFYDPKVHELNFIVCTEGGEPKALLPLWRQKGFSYYEWFGGEFPECNVFMAEDEKYIPILLNEAPKDIWLPYIEISYEKFVEPCEHESSFIVNLEKYGNSLEGYLATFNKKHRKNLKRDMKILADDKKPVLERNRIEDFDRLVELNRQRFSDSSFMADDAFIAGLRKLLMLALERGELEMLSVHIDSKPEAVEAAISKDGTYTVLLGGNNLKISNIGKYLTLEHIKNAIAKGDKVVDFLADDCGWKKLWNMDEVVWCEYSREP